MANPEHLEILRRGIGDWYRWRRENSDIKPDLTGANLRKANLEHFYFRGANLREADLQGANLQEADFREANLQGINLQNTNLQEADFREANLQEANFREANLQEADFREANLQGADLQGTNLQDASFSGASLQNVNLQNANITNANLVKANLSQSNFSKAILSRANFYRAVLTSSSFVKADCRNTIFSKANLESSNLQQAEMVATIALKTNLEGVKITGACIQDWNINSETNLKNVECDYIYLKSRWEKENRKVFFEERRPHNPDEIFASGDFERLLRKAQETVDLIFRNGIDWQAFLNSYEQLKVDAGGDFLPIQAIENKGDGSFVVRIQAPPELDKGKIQKSFET
ncbi:MAG: pentapeptide repeat-containing protein, partial [Cyanobacteria bacterium J06592_8]